MRYLTNEKEMCDLYESQPYIQWNHVDGPMLVCSDGTPHWLTKVERLRLYLGFTSLEQLNAEYSNELQREC